MEKLRVAFCDDDPVFRDGMIPAAEAAFAACGCGIAPFSAGSAEELEEALSAGTFDLLFLDIDMPGMDGIRLGERLRDRDSRADIIYVSNMEEKVYEIFRVHPWSFIRKSRFREELPSVAAEYVRSRRGRSGCLVLPATAGGRVSIEPERIVYAESAGKDQKLFFPAGTESIAVRRALGELERELEPYGFIRVHKGFLVNYRFIRKITSRSVLLDTGGELPVGRDRLKSARERYLDLMRWKGLTPGGAGGKDDRS